MFLYSIPFLYRYTSLKFMSYSKLSLISCLIFLNHFKVIEINSCKVLSDIENSIAMYVHYELIRFFFTCIICMTVKLFCHGRVNVHKTEMLVWVKHCYDFNFQER